MPFRMPTLLAACVLFQIATPAVHAQTTEPYEPQFAQPGKDVVWVPTPPGTLEFMLDLARLTADDYVIDLGSGDGRNVIAAARRGARGHGVEIDRKSVV